MMKSCHYPFIYFIRLPTPHPTTSLGDRSATCHCSRSLGQMTNWLGGVTAVAEHEGGWKSCKNIPIRPAMFASDRRKMNHLLDAFSVFLFYFFSSGEHIRVGLLLWILWMWSSNSLDWKRAKWCPARHLRLRLLWLYSSGGNCFPVTTVLHNVNQCNKHKFKKKMFVLNINVCQGTFEKNYSSFDLGGTVHMQNITCTSLHSTAQHGRHCAGRTCFFCFFFLLILGPVQTKGVYFYCPTPTKLKPTYASSTPFQSGWHLRCCA